jgi:3-deoxy-D-manno-octulosonic-acid transferase
VLAGPHLENFPAITEEMTAAGALRRVESADALGLVVGHLLTNEAARRELSEAALELAATKDDVLERVVTEIDSLLPEAPHQDGGKRTHLAVP